MEILVLGVSFAVVVGYALVHTWRHMMRDDTPLPIYGMLKRQGTAASDVLEIAQAARRCAFCDLGEECRHHLQTGAPLPAACPNARLFARVSRPAA